MQPAHVRHALGGVLAFAALNALAGGWYGMAGASGVPLEWLDGSPFTSYFVPSLILAMVVGGSFLLAAAAVFARHRSARALSLAAGVVVLGWLAVQVAIIGYVSWMQPATAAAGGLVLVLGGSLPRSRVRETRRSREASNMAYRLSPIVVGLMLVQSCCGLLFADHYRDVAWIKATWLGNDGVTLVMAVPLLVLALVMSRHGSTRGRLLWLGLLGYGVYNYAYYVFGAALNVFFPLYVATLLLSSIALMLALAGLDPADIAAQFRASTPVRTIGGYMAIVGAGLAGIWLAMWAAYVFAGWQTPIDTEAFKLVAALDTVIMAPALVTGGVLLWRRRPWGYVLTSIAGVQGSLYLLVLSLNSALAIGRALVHAPVELVLWGGLAALTTSATLLLLFNAGGRHAGS